MADEMLMLYNQILFGPTAEARVTVSLMMLAKQ